MIFLHINYICTQSLPIVNSQWNIHSISGSPLATPTNIHKVHLCLQYFASSAWSCFSLTVVLSFLYWFDLPISLHLNHHFCTQCFICSVSKQGLVSCSLLHQFPEYSEIKFYLLIKLVSIWFFTYKLKEWTSLSILSTTSLPIVKVQTVSLVTFSRSLCFPKYSNQ